MDGLNGYIGKPVSHTPSTLGIYLLNMDRVKQQKKSRRYSLNHRRNSFTFARRRLLVNRLRNLYRLPIQVIAQVIGFSLRTVHRDIIALGRKVFHCANLGFRSKKRWGRQAIYNVCGLYISFKQLCRLAFLYLNGEISSVEGATGDEPP